jgi:hypothetical protein
MSGMQQYAQAYAAQGSSGVGPMAQAMGNAALMLNGGGYNASYQQQQRASFASTMTSSLQSAGPPGSPDDMYTAASAFRTLADPSTMGYDAAQSTLSGLAILARQPPRIMNSSCLSTTASAVGAVIGAAFNFRGSAPRNATASFRGALDVLAALSSAQAEGLSPGQRQDISSDYYTITTRVDALGNSSADLFTSTLAAPNATSAFNPLPAGTFAAASGGNVTTTIMEMSFGAWRSPTQPNVSLYQRRSPPCQQRSSWPRPALSWPVVCAC